MTCLPFIRSFRTHGREQGRPSAALAPAGISGCIVSVAQRSSVVKFEFSAKNNSQSSAPWPMARKPSGRVGGCGWRQSEPASTYQQLEATMDNFNRTIELAQRVRGATRARQPANGRAPRVASLSQ